VFILIHLIVDKPYSYDNLHFITKLHVLTMIINSYIILQYSDFNLDHHSMNVTYKGVSIYFPHLCVLMAHMFLLQVIRLSLVGIDNLGYVSVGVYRSISFF
jgi:hypothetical protein